MKAFSFVCECLFVIVCLRLFRLSLIIPIGSNSKQHLIFHYVTEFNRKVIEEKEMTFSPALVPYKIWRKLCKLEQEKNKKMVVSFLEIKTDYV